MEFFYQNDAGSPTKTTRYQRNLSCALVLPSCHFPQTGGMTKHSQSIVGCQSSSIFTGLTPQSHVILSTVGAAQIKVTKKFLPRRASSRTGMNNLIRVRTPTCAPLLYRVICYDHIYMQCLPITNMYMSRSINQSISSLFDSCYFTRNELR